jgi:hypothetical protein
MQALHVLHVALDKLGLVGATRVDPQVLLIFGHLPVPNTGAGTAV